MQNSANLSDKFEPVSQPPSSPDFPDDASDDPEDCEDEDSMNEDEWPDNPDEDEDVSEKDEPLQSPIVTPIDTRAELAKLAAVSHDTMAKAKLKSEHAPEPLKQRMRSGEVSVSAVK